MGGGENNRRAGKRRYEIVSSNRKVNIQEGVCVCVKESSAELNDHVCFVAINLKKSLISTAAKFRCAGRKPRGSYGFRNTCNLL